MFDPTSWMNQASDTQNEALSKAADEAAMLGGKIINAVAEAYQRTRPPAGASTEEKIACEQKLYRIYEEMLRALDSVTAQRQPSRKKGSDSGNSGNSGNPGNNSGNNSGRSGNPGNNSFWSRLLGEEE